MYVYNYVCLIVLTQQTRGVSGRTAAAKNLLLLLPALLHLCIGTSCSICKKSMLLLWTDTGRAVTTNVYGPVPTIMFLFHSHFSFHGIFFWETVHYLYILYFACFCTCSRSFSSKHSSTMSTIQTDSCQSSYDNLDAQSDSDDYSTFLRQLLLLFVMVNVIIISTAGLMQDVAVCTVSR